MKKFFLPVIALLAGLMMAVYGAGQDVDSMIRVVDETAIHMESDFGSQGSDTVTSASASPEKAGSALEIQPPSISEVISFSKVFWSLIFILIGYFLIRIVTRPLKVIAERSIRYRITLLSLVPVIRIIGWTLILFIVIAGIIQPPLATVVAVTASVGIAVGFASQDILKNIFGGIMILFDRPFQVGDKIEIGSHYGEVVEIGLRSTRIITPDDSLVTVPNGEIMNQSVSNANSGEPNCQVVAEIYLPIDTDTRRVREIALEAARASNYIYLNKPIAVLFFNEVKQRRSYLKMRLKAYVYDIRHEFSFKSDMTETVIRELLAQGVINRDALF